MLSISGPQLRPLAQLLLKFDSNGRVPEVYEHDEKIVVSYTHHSYNERYLIDRSGHVQRNDVIV